MADFCSWDGFGNWTGWTFPDLPVGLIPQKNLLLISLSGLAPIHISQKDRWGWGQDGFYSAAKGFNALLSPRRSSFPPTI